MISNRVIPRNTKANISSLSDKRNKKEEGRRKFDLQGKKRD